MKLREGVRDGSGMVRSRIFLSKCKRQGGSVGEGSGGGVSVCHEGVFVWLIQTKQSRFTH